MTAINKLSSVDDVALDDLLALFSQVSGDTRKIALSQLVRFLTVPELVTQYAAPNATGFSVTIAQADTRLILTPAANYAAGTIVLPAATDGQKVVVSCTTAVTALTITGTTSGAPTTLAAGGFFTLQYDGVLSTWYRVG